MASKYPQAFPWLDHEQNDDFAIYQPARNILVDMAAGGNIASKHHIDMLEEIEMIGQTMSQSNIEQAALMNPGLFSGAAMSAEIIVPSSHEDEAIVEKQVGLDSWAEFLEQPTIDSTSFDIYATTLG